MIIVTSHRCWIDRSHLFTVQSSTPLAPDCSRITRATTREKPQRVGEVVINKRWVFCVILHIISIELHFVFVAAFCDPRASSPVLRERKPTRSTCERASHLWIADLSTHIKIIPLRETKSMYCNIILLYILFCDRRRCTWWQMCEKYKLPIITLLKFLMCYCVIGI